MKWDEAEDHYELSTGRRFYAFSGALAIYNGALVYGWDGEVMDKEVSLFTPAERTEIADEMIARWMKWAAEGQP